LKIKESPSSAVTRETKDKESQRWLDGYQKTEKVIPHSIEVVTITDREGDIFDLLALSAVKLSLLIRATHNRKLFTKQSIYTQHYSNTIVWRFVCRDKP
jgi:hypothetical protein